MRTFVAFTLPDEATSQIAAWQQQNLPERCYPEPPTNLHMTLAFLGDTSEELVPHINEILQQLDPASVQISGPVAYEEQAKLAFLTYQEVGGNEIWEQLNAALKDLMGYEPQFRPWLPHTTVWRFAPDHKPNINPKLPQISFSPIAVTLYQSVRNEGGGATYQKVGAAPNWDLDTHDDLGLPRPLYEGQPVPWSSETKQWADDAGGRLKIPDFSVADHDKLEEAWSESLCVLCGLPLTDPVYVFTGGSGELIDGGLHERCAKLTAAHCPHIRDNVATHAYELVIAPLAEWNAANLANWEDRTVKVLPSHQIISRVRIIPQANILDPIQDELDQRVFKGLTPKPSIVQFVKRVYYRSFAKHFHIPVTQVSHYVNLCLTGSLTTYQYADTSDFDISVFPNYDAFRRLGLDEKQTRIELIRLSINEVDGAFIPGSPHPLQFFCQNLGVKQTDVFQPGLRSGYDLDKGQWVVPPERERSHDVKAEFPDVFHRASEMADKMKVMLDAGDSDSAVELWKQIHEKRMLDQQAGLGDYCEGNIVYKWLVHEGIVDRLRHELGMQISTSVKNTALEPAHLKKWIAEHGPFAYHETGLHNIDSILENGIQVGEDYQDLGLGGTQRPGVAYMWLKGGQQFPLRVDLTKLNPALLVNDEDAAEDLGFDLDIARGREDLADWIDTQHDFDSSTNVLKGMQGGTVGYLGVIPAQAVSHNPEWWMNEKNVRAYNEAVEQDRAWKQRGIDIKKEYDDEQVRLNNGGIIGNLGDQYWDAQGNAYQQLDNGSWMRLPYPSTETDDAMYAQGIISPWRQKMIDMWGHDKIGAPEDWGPMKIDQLSEPYKFEMPLEIEQRFIDAGECPQCHHNLRRDLKQVQNIYCEYCGWQPRVSIYIDPEDDYFQDMNGRPMREHEYWRTFWIQPEEMYNKGNDWFVYVLINDKEVDAGDLVTVKWETPQGRMKMDGVAVYVPSAETIDEAYRQNLPPSEYAGIIKLNPDSAEPLVYAKVAGTMQILYDFEKDRITLGSKEADAHSKLIGNYDSEDNIATLFEAEKQWVNPTYFRRLWNYSFPSYPLKSVQFKAGDTTHKLRTRDHAYHERQWKRDVE